MARPKISGSILWLAGLILLPALCTLAQNSGGVKGVVRNLRGETIGGAIAAARQNGVELKTVKTNSKGQFVLDGLEPGLYNFSFDADGYSTGVIHNIEVKKGKVKDLGGRLMLSVDRGSQVFVRGIVFYRDLTSVYGALVDLLAVNSDGSTQKVASGYTNDMGEFGFTQAPGVRKYRVRASLRGVTGEKDLEITSPMVYRLTIALELDRGKP